MLDGFPAWAPALAAQATGFKAESFATLAQLEAANFWFRSRNALIIWALQRYAPGFTSFLEVGCGTGFVLKGVAEAFPAARIVGSEIFTEGLRFAATRVPEAELLQMDARQVPFVEEFDVVAALDVIEHIEEDETVLRNLHQALKPGGCALISAPQHQWLWSQADDYACHVRRYSAAELHEKVAAAGFQRLRTTSFVSFLLPLMLASRMQSKASQEFDPKREFEIPRLLNAAFEAVQGVERRIIGLGLNFPIGGSRFVVAKRPG